MPGRILYIGSNEPAHRMLFAALRQNHFSIKKCPSPKDASITLQDKQIDLILIAGFETSGSVYTICQRLKNQASYAYIPVVLLCLEKRDLDWGAALTAQADDMFYVSPHSTPEIVNRVKFLAREFTKLAALNNRTFTEGFEGLRETSPSFTHSLKLYAKCEMRLRPELPNAQFKWVTEDTRQSADVIYLPASSRQVADLLDIHRNWPDPPPILCSARPEIGQNPRELLELGAQDLITVNPDPYVLALRAQALARRSKIATRIEARLSEYITLSRIDPLTGLFNRRSWFDLAQGYFRTAQEQSAPLCIAMLDIDHFKSVNDRFGHLVGDRILKSLATVLKSNLRHQDVLCRFGGEEFLILMPKTTLAQARLAIRRLVQKASPMHSFNRDLPQITLSSGLAEISSTDQDLETLIDRADKDMYRAKLASRPDQISYAS